MRSVHRAVADEVVGQLATDDDVRAVLLAGSVAAGIEEETSDVDLLVITHDEQTMKRSIVSGLLVEQVMKTQAGWASACRRPRPMWLYGLLGAELLVDDGAAEAVLADAQQALAGYRTPPDVLGELSVLLWHGRAKVARAARRGGSDAGFWAAIITPSLLDVLYAIHDRPPPPGSLRLDLLAGLPLTSADRASVDAILLASPPEQRISAVASLLDSLLERLPEPDLLAT